MPRAKQRTPELRDRLLHVAVEVLAREGTSGLTTRRVAEQAQTSAPAVYELFGDKAGLVRELFFEGFRSLQRRFERLDLEQEPTAVLLATLRAFRNFVHDEPALAELMFARPFADFDPGPGELAAGAAVRRFVVHRVRRCIEAGVLEGNETDLAHVFVALAEGLAATEAAGRLGTSRASIDRRWALAIDALLRGFAPATTAKSASGPRRRTPRR